MKILVLGASGLLGSRLVPFLEESGFKVIAYSRKMTDESLPLINSQTSVNELLNIVAPNVVINLAGQTNVDVCEENIQEAVLSNTLLPEWISLSALNRAKFHFIHISTDHVYDSLGPHTESNVNIKNVYALTKYCGEKSVINSGGTVLRTNFFGKSFSANRDSFTDWIFKNLNNHRKITAFNDVFFSPLSILTLNRALVRVIELKQPGLYNLGSSSGLSKADFTKIFAKNLNLDLGLIDVDTIQSKKLVANRPLDMRMNCDYFRRQFKFELHSLHSEIENELNFYE